MQPLDGRAVGTAAQVPKAKRHDHLPGAQGSCNAAVSATAVLLPPARSPAHAPVAFAFLVMQPHVEVAVPPAVLRVHQPRQPLELPRQGRRSVAVRATPVPGP